MIINITIKKENDLDYKNEYRFTDFPISIGRENTNDIELIDPKKIVSRKHAKIINSNQVIQLVDLGSRNCSYLNEEKLKAQVAYNLKNGDVLKFGNYKIVISIEAQDQKRNINIDDNKTLAFLSPFAQEVSELAVSLNKLENKYSDTNDQMKGEYLKMDFLSTLSQKNFDNIGPFIFEYFSDQCSNSNKNNKWAEIANPSVVSKEQNFKPQDLESNSSIEAPKDNHSFKSQFSDSFDILLESIAKLIQGFWHFRQEFFGVTIYQSIPITSVEELKKFLFDPSLTYNESRSRLENFNEELSKVQSHQVGLLDGYKDSINDGIENILKELNPEILADKIKKEKFKIGSISIPFKYIPFYAKIKSMQMVKSIHKKIQFDIGIIERKHFRPAFIKGYQKRINI